MPKNFKHHYWNLLIDQDKSINSYKATNSRILLMIICFRLVRYNKVFNLKITWRNRCTLFLTYEAPLLKQCLYEELFWSPFSHIWTEHRFWSPFSRIWTEYGEIRSISPYSVRMRENGDQNNSSYEHFLSSALQKRIKKGLATFKKEFYLKLVNAFQSYTNDKKGFPS